MIVCDCMNALCLFADRRAQDAHGLRRRVTVEIRVPDQQAAEGVKAKLAGLASGLATTSGAKRLAANGNANQTVRVSRVEIVESTLLHPGDGRRSLAANISIMSYPKPSEAFHSAAEQKLTEEVEILQSENTDLRRRLEAALATLADQS